MKFIVLYVDCHVHFDRTFKIISLPLGKTKKEYGFGFIVNYRVEQTRQMSPITTIHFVVLLLFLTSMIYFCKIGF